MQRACSVFASRPEGSLRSRKLLSTLRTCSMHLMECFTTKHCIWELLNGRVTKSCAEDWQTSPALLGCVSVPLCVVQLVSSYHAQPTGPLQHTAATCCLGACVSMPGMEEVLLRSISKLVPGYCNRCACQTGTHICLRLTCRWQLSCSQGSTVPDKRRRLLMS